MCYVALCDVNKSYIFIQPAVVYEFGNLAYTSRVRLITADAAPALPGITKTLARQERLAAPRGAAAHTLGTTALNEKNEIHLIVR